MNSFLKRIIHLFVLTVKEFREQKAELIGAAIAFYLLISLGPVLIIIIKIVGLVFGKAIAEGQIVYEIRSIVGDQPAQVIESVIVSANAPRASKLATIISIPMLVAGSAMVFFQLKNALNYIWGVKSFTSGIVGFLIHYLRSFIMVLFLGGLLICLVIKSFVLTLLHGFLGQITHVPSYVIHTLDVVVTFALLTFLFAIIYKILTEPKIHWTDELIGATVTSLLFTSSQFLMGMYFRNVDIGSALGAVGSFTIMLIWVLYSSLVFLFGAIFTKVYAIQYGSFHIEEEEKKAGNSDSTLFQKQFRTE